MDGEQQSARHDGLPVESAEEHAEHDHPDPPGGGYGSVAGGAGEGVPGGPEQGARGSDADQEPPATDAVAYDDHRDDFPDGRRPAGRSGVSPSANQVDEPED